jgi:ATP-binding cassette subfamily B protein
VTLPSLLLPRSPLALLGFLAATVNALVRVAVAPLVVAPLFDQVLVQGDFDALGGVLALGGAVLLAGALALWAQDALLGALAARTSERWRAGLYQLLLQRPLTPGESSGGLAGRLLADLREVETYLQFGLGTLVAESLTLAGSLAYLFYVNPEATLALLGASLPLALVLTFVGRRIEASAARAQAHLEAVSAHVQEGLAQGEVGRAFGLTSFLLGRFRPANRGAARAQTERALWAGLQTPLAQALGFAALALLLLVLTRSVQAGRMSLGEVTAFITLLALLSTPAQLLPRGYALLQGARAAAARLHALRAAPAQLPPPMLRRAPPRAPVLQLDRVSVSFEGRTVLRDLNATLRGPALIALTGHSGSGKTTLLRLALGLLEPSAGRVLLAGVPLAAFPEAELRRRLAYVPQHVTLFRGSVRDNLLLGRELPESALWEVLDTVALADALRPRGLDAPLAEGGAGLSGGQQQRLAVARALLGDPDVLLLDEPSANLDESSEAVLARVLQGQARSRLVLVVAHRPALMRAAQQVLVLADGKLAPRALLTP